jgi:UPF0716 protein FxsA
MSPRTLLILIVVVALGILPWVEFLLILNLGVSTWVAVVWCVGTGLVGWWHARQEDLSLWTELESDLLNGRVPTEEGVDAMLKLLGAWGLIVPGLLTDLLGAALLVARVRAVLVPAIRGYLREHWIAA